MPKLFIKRTTDGIIKPSTFEFNPKDHWWWTEGNAACDCNRGLAFGEAYDDVKCGDTLYELVNEDGTPFTDWPLEEN